MAEIKLQLCRDFSNFITREDSDNTRPRWVPLQKAEILVKIMFASSYSSYQALHLQEDSPVELSPSLLYDRSSLAQDTQPFSLILT